MAGFIWFWIIVALLIGLGVLLWVVLFRRFTRRRKSNELDDILFGD